MSFLKTMFNSVARTFGRILAYALIGIAIYFIGQHFVNAESIRLRAFNLTDSEFINSTSRSASGNDYMYRALVNIGDSTINTGNTAYFSFDITYGIRTDTLTTNVVQNLYALYWFDTSSNVYNITDSCNVSATKKLTDEGTSQLWQWRVTGTCQVTPSANLSGFLFDTRYTYSGGNPLYGSRKSAINISDFKITNTPSEGQQIIDNANQNTADIINSNNTNTENIIYNQNQNTQEITNAINNQYNVCNNYDLVFKNGTQENDVQGYLKTDGTIQIADNGYYYATSKYYLVNANKSYEIYLSEKYNNRYYCLYNSDKIVIECYNYNNENNITFTPTQNGYVRLTYNVYGSRYINFTGEYCYNSLEKETEQNEEIVDNLHNMLTLLQSDDAPSGSNISSAFGGVNLTDETPFTNLLMFPVLIFSYFSNSMSNSCSPVVLGTLYNHELSLPCLNIPNYLGMTLWNIIDLLFVFYMIYNIAHLFIGILEDITELRSPFLRFFIKNKGVINND